MPYPTGLKLPTHPQRKLRHRRCHHQPRPLRLRSQSVTASRQAAERKSRPSRNRSPSHPPSRRSRWIWDSKRRGLGRKASQTSARRNRRCWPSSTTTAPVAPVRRSASPTARSRSACSGWTTKTTRPLAASKSTYQLCIGCKKCIAKGPDDTFLDGCPWDAIDMVPTAEVEQTLDVKFNY